MEPGALLAGNIYAWQRLYPRLVWLCLSQCHYQSTISNYIIYPSVDLFFLFFGQYTYKRIIGICVNRENSGSAA